MFFFCEAFNFLKEKSHITTPPMLRECIDETHPWREFRWLNVILLCVCTKRDQFVAVYQQQHLRVLTDNLKKSPITNQLMQKCPCASVAFLDLFKPVALSVTGKKVNNLHLVFPRKFIFYRLISPAAFYASYFIFSGVQFLSTRSISAAVSFAPGRSCSR